MPAPFGRGEREAEQALNRMAVWRERPSVRSAMAAFTPRTMRAVSALLGFLLTAGVGHSSLAAEFEPVQQAAAPESSSGRFIVKFRDADGQGARQAKTALDKMAALSTRTGVPLKQARRLGAGLQVVGLGSPATLDNVEASLALLRADPDVEFAEPDLRRYAQAQPNDPLFPGQWYLQNSLSTASAVDAVGAWDLTTGSAGVIVAVLDTGVRYEHPDLLAASAGGKLLPGFDFVLDPALANDGDG
jgi:serine protease